MTEPFATQRFRTSLAQKIGLNSDSSVNRGGKRASDNYIRPRHMAGILYPETRKALFYHAKPCSGNHAV